MTLANDKTFRISFPYNKKNFEIEQTDPAKIYSISDWDFSLNIHSRLVSFNEKGELVAGLAKKFYWKDEVAHFEIRTDFKTIDGKAITPEDVVFSLKRLIKLNSNTHGRLESVICDFKHTDDITKSCTGITSVGQEVLIRTNKKDLLLFKTLTSADFSILRKDSIDPITLKIKDYRNTSGAYYFSHYNEKKNIVLKANPNHWYYSIKMPQEIEMVIDLFGQSDNGKSLSGKFLDGEIDATSISNTFFYKDFKSLLKKLDERNTKYSTHELPPLILTFFKFSQNGLKLQQGTRIEILKEIQRKLKENQEELAQEGRTITSYVFQPNSNGGLPKDQEDKYHAILSSPLSKKTKRETIEIAVLTRNKEVFEKILKDTHFDYKIKSYGSDFDLPKSNSKDAPHLIIGNQDIIFEEDINLLSFAFSTSDMFYLKGNQAENWLLKFRDEKDVSKRITMLKKLHYETLAEYTSVIPLYTTSLRAIATGPWKLHFTKTAETPFWLIKKE